MPRPSLILALIFAAALAAIRPACASEPLTIWGGRLAFAGDASFTLAEVDHGYFNYTDYSQNALRLARLNLDARLQAGEHVALLAEVRSDNLDAPRAYGLYLRLRPWTERSLDFQIGRIPPVFGSFPRRRYGTDNPLIGYPLSYQYLTIVRSDAAPVTADDLVRQRGDGWSVRYPIGSYEHAAGLPMVSAFRWDTGVQARIGYEPLSLSVAVTQGTLGSPRLEDDNDGKQLSARFAWKPTPAFELGLSGARGEYAARSLQRALPPGTGGGPFRQRALGADVELSHGYWLLRSEVLWTEWDVPVVAAPFVDSPLRALAVFVEGRYKIVPRLYAAARVEHLDFGKVRGFRGESTWDAPVSRIEAGLGYAFERHVVGKLAYQYNWRDGGPLRQRGFVAVQLLAWF
jgi:hypothetical protein